MKGGYRLGDVVNPKSATTLPGGAEIAEEEQEHDCGVKNSRRYAPRPFCALR